MDEMTKALKRHKARHIETNPTNYISKAFTKVLLSIILVLIATIYIKLNPDNKVFFEKYIFSNNLCFTKINEWTHKTFGTILPTVSTPVAVVSQSSEINHRENYLDGYKITTNSSSPVKVIKSGLLIFAGEKEGYGNVFIIQGLDGTDIWYGNITDTNYKLYDYIDAESILGNTKDNYYYLVFMKDNKYITYEDYYK